MTGTAAQPALLLVAIGAFAVVWKASTYDNTATSNPYYYGIIVVAALVSLMFHGIRAGGFLGRVDRWLGDLSYPVFLIHYPAGYMVWLAMGQPVHVRRYIDWRKKRTSAPTSRGRWYRISWVGRATAGTPTSPAYAPPSRRTGSTASSRPARESRHAQGGFGGTQPESAVTARLRSVTTTEITCSKVGARTTPTR